MRFHPLKQNARHNFSQLKQIYATQALTRKMVPITRWVSSCLALALSIGLVNLGDLGALPTVQA